MKKAIIFLFTLMLTVTLVACSKDVNYKLTLPDNVNADVTDLNSVKADTLVTLTISEKEGYVVDSLTANDKELVISNNQATFVMVTDTVVKISFKEVELEQLYSLQLPKEVTANITNLDSIKFNTKITLTVNVKENQIVDTFKINGEEVSLINNEHTFNIKKDTVVTVTFKDIVADKYYKLTLPDNVSANVSNLNKIKEGTSVVLTVNIPKDKDLLELKVDGTVVDVVLDTFTFVIKKDTEVLVTFKDIVVDNYYKLTLPDNVSADVSDLNRIKEGTSIVLTIDIPEGMKLKELKIDGVIVDVNDDTYTFIIRKDILVSVIFEDVETIKDTFKLTLPEGVRAFGYNDLDNIPKGTEIDLRISIGKNEIVSSFKINGVETKYINRIHTFKISEDTIVEITYEESIDEKVNVTFSEEVTIGRKTAKEFEFERGEQVTFTIRSLKDYENLNSYFIDETLIEVFYSQTTFYLYADDNYEIIFNIEEVETVVIKLVDGITIDSDDNNKVVKNSFVDFTLNNKSGKNIKQILFNGMIVSFVNNELRLFVEEDIEIEIINYEPVGEDYTRIDSDEVKELFENLDPQFLKDYVRNQLKYQDSISSWSNESSEVILDLNPDITKRDFYFSNNGDELFYGKDNIFYGKDNDGTYKMPVSLSNYIINDILYDLGSPFSHFDFKIGFNEDLINFVYDRIILENIDYELTPLKVFKKDDYYKIELNLTGEETKLVNQFHNLIDFSDTTDLIKNFENASYNLEVYIKDLKITNFKSKLNNNGETRTIEYNEYHDEILVPYGIDIENAIDIFEDEEDIVDFEIYDGNNLIFKSKLPRSEVENHRPYDFEENGIEGEGFYYDEEFSEPVDLDNIVGDNIKFYLKYEEIYSFDDMKTRVNNDTWGYRISNEYYFEDLNFIYYKKGYTQDNTVVIKDKHTNQGYYLKTSGGQTRVKYKTNADYFFKDFLDVKSIINNEFILLNNRYYSPDVKYYSYLENRLSSIDDYNWSLEIFNDKLLDEYINIDIEELIKDIDTAEEVNIIIFDSDFRHDIRDKDISDDINLEVIYKTDRREMMTFKELSDKFDVRVEFPTSENDSLRVRVNNISVGSASSYDSNRGPLLYLGGDKKYLNENLNLFEEIEKDDFFVLKGIRIGDKDNGEIFSDMESLYEHFEDKKYAVGSTIREPKEVEVLKEYLDGKYLKFEISYDRFHYDYETKTIFNSSTYKHEKIEFSDDGFIVSDRYEQIIFPNTDFGLELFLNYIKEDYSFRDFYTPVEFILFMLGKTNYKVNDNGTILYGKKSFRVYENVIYLDTYTSRNDDKVTIIDEIVKKDAPVFEKSSEVTNNLNDDKIIFHYNENFYVDKRYFKFKDLKIDRIYKFVDGEKVEVVVLDDDLNYYFEFT